MLRCAVLGLGRFGRTLAAGLYNAGAEVIAIDQDAQVVAEARDEVTFAVRMDSTDIQALRAQGVDKVDVAVVCMGESFEANTLTTLLLKRMGVKRIIARAGSPEHGRVLRLVGADEVVQPEEVTAQTVARRLVQPNIVDYIPLGLLYSVVEIRAPKSFWGKTLADLDLRRRYGATIIALRRDDEARPFPGPEDTIQEGDILVAVGLSSDLAALSEA